MLPIVIKRVRLLYTTIEYKLNQSIYKDSKGKSETSFRDIFSPFGAVYDLIMNPGEITKGSKNKFLSIYEV